MIKFKYISLLFATWLLMAVNLVGQNIAINENGADLDNSAMLDVTSTERGGLIPRMKAAQNLAISSPANGLLVFQTDVPRGFYVYFAANTVWTRLSVDTTLNLERVLAGGNNVNKDSIVNLGALGIGVPNPVRECATAPLNNIPNGATITNITYIYYDNDPVEDVTIAINRTENLATTFVGFGSFTSNGASTAYKVQSVPVNLTIDYRNNYYSVYFEGRQENLNLRLKI